MAKVLTGEERKRYLVKLLCLLYGATNGNIGLHLHRIGIFNLMEIGEYSDIEDTVARELVDELIKKGKGLIVEEGNEGQIRLRDIGGI